jgi:hypothetical protein
VPLKSIEHRNTDTGPQEVKEDPMTTTGTQGEQWTRSVFYTLLCSHRQKGNQKKSHISQQISLFLFLLFSFSFLFFYERMSTNGLTLDADC